MTYQPHQTEETVTKPVGVMYGGIPSKRPLIGESFWQRGCDDAKAGRQPVLPTSGGPDDRRNQGYVSGYRFGKATLAAQAQQANPEREAFEAAWLAIHGGNRIWIERADELARGDRLTYCEVWTRRAWLLWQKARTHGVHPVEGKSCG
jgi:hypothetical protein